jgi:hypothetical protein
MSQIRPQLIVAETCFGFSKYGKPSDSNKKHFIGLAEGILPLYASEVWPSILATLSEHDGPETVAAVRYVVLMIS